MKKDKKLDAAKLAAKRIVERSAAMGITVSHGQALELVATDRGFANWHAYAASLRKGTPIAAVPAWSASQGPMTDEQYLAYPEPNCCPCCGSDEIEGESIEIDGREALQDCSCSECGAEWEDRYQLARYNLTYAGNGAAPGNREVELRDAWEATGSGESFDEWLDNAANDPDHTLLNAVQAQISARDAARPDAGRKPPVTQAFNVAAYDGPSHAFQGMGVAYGNNKEEAQRLFADVAGLRSQDSLEFYVEPIARVRADVAGLVDWWNQNDPAEDALDELVCESVQEKGIPAVNEASSAAEQDALLDDADAQASRINNEGIEAQLTYLVSVLEPQVLLTRLGIEVGLQGHPAVVNN